MSKVTELATAQLTVSDIITVELIEADENWPWSSSAGRGSPPCSSAPFPFGADGTHPRSRSRTTRSDQA
jgi:hypothetical protein